MIPDPFIKARASADALVEGCYLIRRDHQRRVPLPVRIWWGPPADPETGEPLDRSPRWQVSVAGQIVDEEPLRVGCSLFTSLADFWPACAKHPITIEDHDYRLSLARWAGEYDPNDPRGDTQAVIDPMTATLPFCQD